jgi:hypothetical protein
VHKSVLCSTRGYQAHQGPSRCRARCASLHYHRRINRAAISGVWFWSKTGKSLSECETNVATSVPKYLANREGNLEGCAQLPARGVPLPGPLRLPPSWSPACNPPTSRNKLLTLRGPRPGHRRGSARLRGSMGLPLSNQYCTNYAPKVQTSMVLARLSCTMDQHALTPASSVQLQMKSPGLQRFAPFRTRPQSVSPKPRIRPRE